MNIKKNQNTSESKAKTFWKNMGFIGIALALAIVTVFMLNFN